MRCVDPSKLPWILALSLAAVACSDDGSRDESAGELGSDASSDEAEDSSSESGSESSSADAGTSSSSESTDADSSSETETSESTETSETETETSESTETEPDTEEGSGDTGIELAPWLVNIENLEDNSVHRLNRISIAPGDIGTKTVVCDDISFPDTLPQTGNIVSSLTFNNYTLYAVAERFVPGDTIIEINPCDCSAQEVGQFNQGESYVGALTSTGLGQMFAIASQPDWLFAVDPETAMTTLLSILGDDWGTSGLTWAGDRQQTLWAISGTHDALFEFSSADGMELSQTPLTWDFASVGMEYHPGVDTLYACTNTGELLAVDPESGVVVVVGDPQIESCNNIAAPFGPVECIPQ